MQLARYLHRDFVVSDSPAENKEEVLRELSRLLARQAPHLDEERIYRLLLEREEVQSTAVDDGIAIPHAKAAEVSEPRCCLV